MWELTVGGTIPWAGNELQESELSTSHPSLLLVSKRNTSRQLELLPEVLGQDGLYPFTMGQSNPFPLNCCCQGIFVTVRGKEAKLPRKNTSDVIIARMDGVFTCQT